MKFYKQLKQVEVMKTDLTKEQYECIESASRRGIEFEGLVPSIDGSTIPKLVNQLQFVCALVNRSSDPELDVSDEDLTELIAEFGSLTYRIDVEGNYTTQFDASIEVTKEEVEEDGFEDRLFMKSTLDDFDLTGNDVCDWGIEDSECSGKLKTTLRLALPSVDWS
jgi:hypothetical protein